MRRLLPLIFILCYGSIYGQDTSLAKKKSSRMLKIDKIVAEIDQASTLNCYIATGNFTRLDSMGINYPAIPLKTQFVSSTQKQLPSLGSQAFFFLRDSALVKVIFNDVVYHFHEEKLIRSYFECQGPVDLLIQCKPGYSLNYNYYWNNRYRKSLILDQSIGTCDGCGYGNLFPKQNKQTADWLLKKWREIR